jgi:4-amino-4-deoxy-L-arabinose transferase-like glycosyltransferase
LQAVTSAKPAFRLPVPPLLLIVLLAVLLRAGFILAAPGTLSLDASGYDDYAVNLMAGNGYTRMDDLRPDSDLPPLYPAFLVVVYSVFGRDPVAVAAVQIVFDVVMLVALYAIGRRVGGERVGLLAALFTAVYPYLLFQNLSTNDTGIFIMLLALAVWMLLRAADERRIRWAVGAGMMLGIAALTKSLVLLMLPLIALWWWRMIGFRRAVLFSLALGVGFAVFVTPWILRNTALHGQLTFLSTNDGSNLYQGNNPCVADYLSVGWDAQWVNCLNPTPPGMSETETSRWFRDQALTYLREHPGEWPRLFGVKFITLWTPELLPRTVPPTANLDDPTVLQYEESPLFQAARIVHVLYFGPLLALAIIGALRAARTGTLLTTAAPLLIICIAITVTYVIYHPSTRYRAPADPFVFVFSALAATWLWDRVRGKANAS